MKANSSVSQSARIRRSEACSNSLGLLSPHNLARRVVLVSRYRARVRLAKLEAFPEGYEWQNPLHDGKTRSVILLTPPGLVAIRRADGSWVRRTRIVARHGPAPYTQDWYSEYLRNSGLPTWFFLAGHGEVLSNAAEASLLGEELDGERGKASSGYQKTRYPSEPWGHAMEGDGTYKYKLTDAEQRCLARRFPATNILNQEREVLLLPGGYIQMHHDPTSLDHPTLEPGQLRWRKGGPASYIEEGQDTGLASIPPIDNASRNALIQKARQDGGITGLTSVPRGEGEYSWLEETDRHLALALGYGGPEGNPSPKELIVARENGALATGIHPLQGPVVVFKPEDKYFNPSEQPDGRGHWIYFTKESQHLAQLLFALKAEFGLAAVRNVTAEQVWRIRDEYISKLEFDNPTAEVDIVWVPADSSYAELKAPDAEEDEEEETAVSRNVLPAPPLEDDLGFGIDEVSGLAHDPAAASYNQTAVSGEAPLYQTRMIKSEKYTIDRAAAKANSIPQEAKLWVPDKGGRWNPYPQKHLIDWSDKKSVDALNKWRDQVCHRNGWPGRTGKSFVKYTQDEKRYIQQQVEAVNGDSSKLSISDVTKAFNKRFNNARNMKREEGGIRQQIHLLAKEYKKARGPDDPSKNLAEDGVKGPARKKRKIQDDDGDALATVESENQTLENDPGKQGRPAGWNDQIVVGGSGEQLHEADT